MTNATRRRDRRGFTLTEMLVALTILAVVGAAMVRLLTSQSRFTEDQLALRNARTVSRNAMNIMLTDLRMVQDAGGLAAATKDSVTVDVALNFGLLCATAVTPTISLLPVDSAMTALGKYAGWAYRDSASGLYTYVTAAVPTPTNSLPTGVTTTCSDSVIGPGILPMTVLGRTGRVVTVPDAATGVPNAGWPVFLFQRVTYKFGPSGAYPGRVGLFRLVKTSDPAAPMSDEIVAPFDTSAKFRFYVLNEDTAQSAPPANLNTVRGLQLVLAGASPRVPRSGAQAKQAGLVTGVFFKNRRDP